MPQKTYMYDTQWTALLNAINTGDSSAVVTALNTIKNSLDNITNAISNQTITVDLSDINSDNVLNLSDVTGRNITNALDNLNNLSKLCAGVIEKGGSITLSPKVGSNLLLISRVNQRVYCGLVFDKWGEDITTAFGTLPSNLMVVKNASTNNVSITNHLGFSVTYTLI